MLAVNKNRCGSLSQIGLISIHGTLSVENFVLTDVNLGLSGICEPIWALG